MQDYVARNSARASTAKQAQSRAKMLAKMQPITALIDDPTLSFDFPNPSELRPPLIALDLAAVGYGEKTILQRLNLRIDPDDRIALLGRNGNGKTTLARLLAAQLPAMEGSIHQSGKMQIGYFTQYQVEELAGDATPLEHMTRAMTGKTPGAIRAQLGRFGFSGNRAIAQVGTLSGGERARLALALVTRDAPHLLILDEPTNHLDVDAREALVQALNSYEGAVILISHDRHMVELTADRLVLVDHGTAVDYPGSMEDYIDFVLGRNQPKGNGETRPKASKQDKKANAQAREAERALKKQVSEAEAAVAKLQAQVSALDRAMFDPKSAAPDLAKLAMGELSRRRAAQAEPGQRRHRPHHAVVEPQRLAARAQPRRKRRGGHVKRGPHQDRRPPGQHVADDPADAAGDHPHQHRRHRGDAISQRLGRAEHGIGAQAHRIGPLQRLNVSWRILPPAVRSEPCNGRHAQAHRRHPRIAHPEHRRADQQVAHRTTAHPGDQREEGHRHDGLPHPRRQQRTRQREHRHPRQIEQADDLRQRDLERGRDQRGRHP
ncbi:MAG: hypothetical protein NVS3B27_04710 [Novosphingobium sp.]